MAKDVIQECFACSNMDCYYFECLKRFEGCKKFKLFERGMRLNAKGEVVEEAKKEVLNGG